MSEHNKNDRLGLIALGLMLLAIVLVAPLGLLSETGHVASTPSSDDGWRLLDPYAQWLMATFAILAVGVSFLGLRWLRETFAQTKRTADAAIAANATAREMGEAQVRAYVSISEVTGAINPDPKRPRATFTATMQNSGQTPARQISYNVNIVRVDEDGRRVIAWNSRSYDEPADLLPGASRGIFNDGIDLTEEQFARLSKGRLVIMFEGRISYETVFHRRWVGWTPSTTFKYEVIWRDRENTTELTFVRTKDGNHAL